MTILFPRPLLSPIRRSTFDLKSFVATAGAGSPAIESRPPLWGAEYETPPLTDAQLAAWRAWWISLRGGLLAFFAHDPKQPFPLAYRNLDGLARASGTPFDGTCTVTGLTETVLSLSGLPAYFSLAAGDKVGLVQTSYRSLHMVMESTAANGSGAATILVEPRIPTSIFTTSAVANFARPVVKMRIRPGSWSNPTDIGPNPISFGADQHGY